MFIFTLLQLGQTVPCFQCVCVSSKFLFHPNLLMFNIVCFNLVFRNFFLILSCKNLIDLQVNATSPSTVIVVANVIMNSEFKSGVQQRGMVEKLLQNLKLSSQSFSYTYMIPTSTFIGCLLLTHFLQLTNMKQTSLMFSLQLDN